MSLPYLVLDCLSCAEEWDDKSEDEYPDASSSCRLKTFATGILSGMWGIEKSSLTWIQAPRCVAAVFACYGIAYQSAALSKQR